MKEYLSLIPQVGDIFEWCSGLFSTTGYLVLKIEYRDSEREFYVYCLDITKQEKITFSVKVWDLTRPAYATHFKWNLISRAENDHP